MSRKSLHTWGIHRQAFSSYLKLLSRMKLCFVYALNQRGKGDISMEIIIGSVISLHTQKRFIQINTLLLSSYPSALVLLFYNIHVLLLHLVFNYAFKMTVVPQYPQGIGSRIPVKTKICGCTGHLHKVAKYLHTTYTHPPVYFKSSLDYL